VLIGGGGKNVLDGDAGRDVLVCHSGQDQCNGGGGVDTFVTVP
jgi:Ca2+-binding RTX toxin-like protein